MRLEHEEGAPCTAIREVSLLRSLKHANVVTLHDIIYTDRVLTLVFEFLERDLREHMEEINGLICIENVKVSTISRIITLHLFLAVPCPIAPRLGLLSSASDLAPGSETPKFVDQSSRRTEIGRFWIVSQKCCVKSTYIHFQSSSPIRPDKNLLK
jgi:hypothetical protein